MHVGDADVERHALPPVSEASEHVTIDETASSVSMHVSTATRANADCISSETVSSTLADARLLLNCYQESFTTKLHEKHLLPTEHLQTPQKHLFLPQEIPSRSQHLPDFVQTWADASALTIVPPA